MPYLMVYYLSNTSFLQSVGFLLIEYSGSVRKERTTVLGFLKNVFVKPPILGVIFAICMLLLDLSLPDPLMRFAGYVSDSVTPLALIYCGFIVYEVGLRNLRPMQGHMTMLLMRLVCAPAVCLCFCSLFGMTGLARNTFAVESALPVVSQVTVMAGDFGADDKYAATGATLSTLACFITIPVLMVLMG